MLAEYSAQKQFFMLFKNKEQTILNFGRKYSAKNSPFKQKTEYKQFLVSAKNKKKKILNVNIKHCK